jgi:hypothetical protein
LQKELSDDPKDEHYFPKNEKDFISAISELNNLPGKIQEIICDTKPEDIKIDKVYLDKMIQKPEEAKEEVKPKKKKNKK